MLWIPGIVNNIVSLSLSHNIIACYKLELIIILEKQL